MDLTVDSDDARTLLRHIDREFVEDDGVFRKPGFGYLKAPSIGPDHQMRLDIDPKTHPAWTGVRQSVDRGGRVQRFKDRFGAGAGTKSSGKAAAAPATPAKDAAKKK